MTTQVFQRTFSEFLAPQQAIPSLSSTSQLMRALPPWITARLDEFLERVIDDTLLLIVNLFLKFAPSMRFTQKLFLSFNNPSDEYIIRSLGLTCPRLDEEALNETILGTCCDLQVLRIQTSDLPPSTLSSTLSSTSHRFLRELHLRYPALSDDSVAHIAQNLKSTLESLHLEAATALTNNAMKSIAKLLPRLRVLCLPGSRGFLEIDDNGFMELTKVPADHLRVLRISGLRSCTHVTIAALGHFRNLEELETLFSTHSMMDPVPDLENSVGISFPQLTRLRALRFADLWGRTHADDAYTVALPASLKVLDGILISGSDAVRKIATQCPDLERLHLHQMSVVCCDSFASISTSTTASVLQQSLKSLRMECDVRKSTVPAAFTNDDFASWLGKLTQLEELELRSTAITNEAVSNLIPKLSRLQRLKLYTTEVDERDTGLNADLAFRIGSLNQLTHLHLDYLGSEGAAALGRAAPNILKEIECTYRGDLESLGHFRRLPSLRRVNLTPDTATLVRSLPFTKEEAHRAIYGNDCTCPNSCHVHGFFSSGENVSTV